MPPSRRRRPSFGSASVTGPRSVSGRGSQAKAALAPHSRKPGTLWTTRPRALMSKLTPLAGSTKARPPPMSAPSPASRRRRRPSRSPISKDGVALAPSPNPKGRDPSMPARTSQTLARDASSATRLFRPGAGEACVALQRQGEAVAVRGFPDLAPQPGRTHAHPETGGHCRDPVRRHRHLARSGAGAAQTDRRSLSAAPA